MIHQKHRLYNWPPTTAALKQRKTSNNFLRSKPIEHQWMRKQNWSEKKTSVQLSKLNLNKYLLLKMTRYFWKVINLERPIVWLSGFILCSYGAHSVQKLSDVVLKTWDCRVNNLRSINLLPYFRYVLSGINNKTLCWIYLRIYIYFNQFYTIELSILPTKIQGPTLRNWQGNVINCTEPSNLSFHEGALVSSWRL